jgi:hypothetical protein
MPPQKPNSNLPNLATNKSLAIPAHRKRPSFEEVAAIVLMGATISKTQGKKEEAQHGL